MQKLFRSILITAFAGIGLVGCKTTTSPWANTSASANAVPTTTVSIFAKKPEASPELNVATARYMNAPAITKRLPENMKRL